MTRKYTTLRNKTNDTEAIFPNIDPEHNIPAGSITPDKLSNSVYSLQEVEIGTWVNGATLYRRVFEIQNVTILPTGTNIFNLPVGGWKVVNIGGVYQSSTTNNSYNLNGFIGQEHIGWGINGTLFKMYSTTELTPLKLIIIVDYIK